MCIQVAKCKNFASNNPVNGVILDPSSEIPVLCAGFFLVLDPRFQSCGLESSLNCRRSRSACNPCKSDLCHEQHQLETKSLPRDSWNRRSSCVTYFWPCSGTALAPHASRSWGCTACIQLTTNKSLSTEQTESIKTVAEKVTLWGGLPCLLQNWPLSQQKVSASKIWSFCRGFMTSKVV